jgi:hypothetical protein
MRDRDLCLAIPIIRSLHTSHSGKKTMPIGDRTDHGGLHRLASRLAQGNGTGSHLGIGRRT